jgi:ferritin-like metal-binding protein YciE
MENNPPYRASTPSNAFAAMSLESPLDLLLDQIRDLYSAESQVVLTLPELAAISPDENLRSLLLRFEQHAMKHKERLKEACERLEATVDGDICKAMQGLIEGGNQHIAQAKGRETQALILIAHVNRILHYQIGGYSFATALAGQLGLEEIENSLNVALREENACVFALAEAAGGILQSVTEELP